MVEELSKHLGSLVLGSESEKNIFSHQLLSIFKAQPCHFDWKQEGFSIETLVLKGQYWIYYGTACAKCVTCSTSVQNLSTCRHLWTLCTKTQNIDFTWLNTILSLTTYEWAQSYMYLIKCWPFALHRFLRLHIALYYSQEFQYDLETKQKHIKNTKALTLINSRACEWFTGTFEKSQWNSSHQLRALWKKNSMT